MAIKIIYLVNNKFHKNSISLKTFVCTFIASKNNKKFQLGRNRVTRQINNK